MTNLQLLLSIGIPSFLVLLSMLINNKRTDDLNKRIDDLTKVFDKRFEGVDRRFETIDRRLDEILKAVHSDTLEILRNMTDLHERVAIVESKQRT